MKNTYSEMKNSGVAWIGDIPLHWTLTKMKCFLYNKSVKGYPQEQVLSLYREFGVIPKDSRNDNHNVTSEDTAAYKYVEAGDLVINKMKAWQGSLGVSEYTGIVSPAYYVCGFKSKNANKHYFHYMLRSKNYAQEFECLSTGMRIGQWDLGIDDFMRVPAILPPLPEQTAIAAYLDEKCGTIDEIIAEAKASIEEYKMWKSSVIFEAVTKGLDPNTEMKDSGVEWIGKVPKIWKVTSLKRVSRIQTGNTPSKQSQENYYSDDDGTPWIKADNLGTCNSIETTSEYLTAKGVEAARLNPENTVYVCCIGTIGKTGFSTKKCTCNQQINAVVFNDLMFWKFGFYSICAQEEQHWFYANGNVLKILNTENQKNIKITIPPMKEQRCIVDYLDKKCAAIDGIIAEKEALIADMEAYKKSLIFETVTGKRKVC